MSSLTTVTCEDIELLNPTTLVDLLRILLYSEAKKHDLVKPGIHVPAQITVADGGNDGEWFSTEAPCDYIPCPLTIYQSKASELDADACVNELIVKSKKTADGRKNIESLKPQVQKIVDKGGAYVFFCKKGYTTQSLEKRLEDAEAKLEELDVDRSKIELHFLDGNQIASWANDHAAARFFVMRCAGRTMPFHVETFDYWAGHREFVTSFETSAKLNVIIKEFRDVLLIGPTITRLTGHSGLGKTRLALEVFRHQTDDTDADELKQIQALAKSCVYWDAADNSNDVLVLLRELNSLGVSGTVIIDNCNRALHFKIQREIEHESSKLAVLTLDFGEESGVPGYLSHKLTPEMMMEIVPSMLRSSTSGAGEITDAQIDQVKKFAQGFPRIARLVLDSGQALDWSTMNDHNMASRLVWGRMEEREPGALRLLETIALFTNIGCQGDVGLELEFLCDEMCGGMTVATLKQQVHPFKRNQVLQQIGDYWHVTPVPLALALAAEWLERMDDDQVYELFEKLEAVGLGNRFAQRIRVLDFSDRAQELSEHWLGESGPFGSAKVLNSEVGSKVFRSLSELNPPAALACLDREFGRMTPEQASEVVSGRRNLVWALEKLCWKADEFPVGARVLMALASGETETYSNNATKTFCELFHLMLSGTQCPAIDRLELIEEGLKSEHSEARLRCIQALGASFTWERFMRSGGRENRGTQYLGVDWKPEGWDDIYEYWTKSFHLLKDIALSGVTVESEAAQNALSKAVGTISAHSLMKTLEPDFIEVAAYLNNTWPAVRDAFKHKLSYRRKKMAPEHVALIESLLAQVQPDDLRSRLIDTIAKPGWHTEEKNDGGLRDLSREAAESLAKELFESGEDWKQYMDVLLLGDQQQTGTFAATWMSLEANQAELFQQALDVFSSLPKEDRNVAFLRGLIHAIKGTELRTDILEQLAADSELREPLLATLTQSAASDLEDFQRVFDLVASGDLPNTAVHTIGFSFALQDIDSEDLIASLTRLIEVAPVTKPDVFYLLSQYFRDSRERSLAVRPLVEILLTSREVIQSKNIQLIDYQWQQAVTATLASEPEEAFVERLASTLVDILINDGQHISTYSDAHIVVIVRLLLKNHSEIAWPLFESSLRDDDGELRYFAADFLASGGTYDASGSALWELSPDQFREWAKDNVDLLPFFLSKMQLFFVEREKKVEAIEPQADGRNTEPDVAKLVEVVTTGMMSEYQQGDKFVWHPLAEVLMEFTDEEYLFSSLHSNLFSFSSTGSRVPYLENRVVLIEDLEKRTGRSELKSVTRRLAAELKSQIEREKKRDAHREIGQGW